VTQQQEVIFDESHIRIPKKADLLKEVEENNQYLFDHWRIGLKQAFERNLSGNFESADKLLAIRKLKEILTPLVLTS
jgi:hypothetical protein